MDLGFREIRIFEKDNCFSFIDNSSKEEMFTMSKSEFKRSDIHVGTVAKYKWKDNTFLTVCLEIRYQEGC